MILTRPSPNSGRAAGEGGFACIDVAQVKSQSMAKTLLPMLEASKVSKVPKVPKEKKMRAAIYTRISTKTNEKKSGTHRQLKSCQSKAKDDGVQVTPSVSEPSLIPICRCRRSRQCHSPAHPPH